MEVEARDVHDDEDDGEDERHRQRDDDAGAQAEGEEADDEDDDQRLDEDLEELRDRLVDDVGLVGDLDDVDADRQLGDDAVHRLIEHRRRAR